MNEEVKYKMDPSEIDRAQKLIYTTLEINNVKNLNAFGALSLYAILIARDGSMEKHEFIYAMNKFWDSIENNM